MLSLRSRWSAIGLVVVLSAVVGLLAPSLSSHAVARRGRVQQVTVPGADRFTPFALTIRAGETVRWVNQDTDDHTVVSDDQFNSAGHNGTNQLLPGTDSNNGKPGTVTLTFEHAGTFVYYCRFHAHLDSEGQPAAPGPRGGIQDAGGNFGTPMMGVITVLPDDGED
jgi:plastocyanin